LEYPYPYYPELSDRAPRIKSGPRFKNSKFPENASCAEYLIEASEHTTSRYRNGDE
jgi:hypothetical protein